MKRVRSCVAVVLTLLVLLTLSTNTMAAGSGTQADPHLGGNAYGHADANSIVLHKLDVGAFERKKAKDLIDAGTLPAGGTVTYKGKIATGTSLASTSVVGSYTTSASATEHDVTLAELAALGNIIFQIEQVALISGKTPGSVDPDDYSLVSSGINHYAKTDSGTGEITWSGLATGYYRITEIGGSTGAPVGVDRFVISLPMADPTDDSKTLKTVHIYPKNRATSGPVIEKEKPDLNDYNGNILPWTVRAEIPATLKPTKGVQTYVITDTMSHGLQFAGNLKVYYKSGGTDVELTKGTDYSTPVANGDTTLVITLEGPGFTKLGNALPGGIDKDSKDHYILYVEYDTVVNISKADLDANTDPENEVHLEFTNDDGTKYEDKTDPPVIVEDYAKLKVIKKDGANTSILLENAKFKVYTKLSGTAIDTTSALKDATGAEIEFTTDSLGEFIYGGLGAGDYYIVETAVPPGSGYKLLTSYTTITISATDVDNKETKEATILNYLDNGLTLPTTGGIGTLLFTAGGLALIVGAVILFLVSRKRASKKERRFE